MPLIPAEQNVFIIDVHYTVSLDEIEPALDAHVEFLEQNFASGCFIASGPKVPRTGGVIIATAATRDELEDILEADPFKKQGLATYAVTEFTASMRAKLLTS